MYVCTYVDRFMISGKYIRGEKSCFKEYAFNMASYVSEDDSTMNDENTSKPRIILLFSGKRKCGKDYITNALQER